MERATRQFHRRDVRRGGAFSRRIERLRPNVPVWAQLCEVFLDTAAALLVPLAQARDKDVAPCSIARRFPQPKLTMRVVELDEDEGTFVLERIDN